jgi:hypothetical protein
MRSTGAGNAPCLARDSVLGQVHGSAGLHHRAVAWRRSPVRARAYDILTQIERAVFTGGDIEIAGRMISFSTFISSDGDSTPVETWLPHSRPSDVTITRTLREDGTRALVAAGDCERIFDGRFAAMDELAKMGADTNVNGETATIRGRTPLTGTAVTAHDLRTGVALVLAGLAADGQTVIGNGSMIERGHSALAQRLAGLGADIAREVVD